MIVHPDDAGGGAAQTKGKKIPAQNIFHEPNPRRPSEQGDITTYFPLSKLPNQRSFEARKHSYPGDELGQMAMDV